VAAKQATHAHADDANAEKKKVSTFPGGYVLEIITHLAVHLYILFLLLLLLLIVK
jgi:hypothetical protein